jgi:nicotinate-nucleotide adenylyltransferase
LEKVGLFFGSFNPIHKGHTFLAKQILEKANLNKVWFVVSPQNPLKENTELLDEKTRLLLVRLAIKNEKNFVASDVEFHLNKPSYTINTLDFLKEKYPNKLFSIIMGMDNFDNFHLWKNYQEILNNYTIYIYPRKEQDNEENNNKENLIGKNIVFFSFPLLNISSTIIREKLRNKESIENYVEKEVKEKIEKNNLYCNS